MFYTHDKHGMYMYVSTIYRLCVHTIYVRTSDVLSLCNFMTNNAKQPNPNTVA